MGRIPDGGGHRVHGRAKGNRIKKNTRPGTAFIHNAADDHSRLAYAEILGDERKETASAFWQRANAYLVSCGITVKRVLTDNGSETERVAELPNFLHTYNHHRGNTALKGASPAERVPNLCGHNI